MMTKRSNHMPMLTKSERIQTQPGVAAHRLEPEELRGDHVAGDHDPVGPGSRVRTRG